MPAPLTDFSQPISSPAGTTTAFRWTPSGVAGARISLGLDSDAESIDGVIASASSNHVGGVHVMMADGAIIFVKDSIDTGDLSKPGVSYGDGYTAVGSKSPYGVWGAAGTRASKEVVDRKQLRR